MTQPSVETRQSGEAADAVGTLQAELSRDYAEIRSAEVALTEAILGAHAVTDSGRARLQDVQRQLIEAINSPLTALDTPAGERQFLLFLRGTVAQIQDIVDTGALTDEDHARLTRALGSGYLLSTSDREENPAPVASSGSPPTADQGAGVLPAVGSALGALPQAAQGAATAPAQAASGLAGAASPLAGLASGLLERTPEPDVPDDGTEHDRATDEPEDVEEDQETETDGDDTDDRSAQPRPPGDREQAEDGPAQTRPARLP